MLQRAASFSRQIAITPPLDVAGHRALTRSAAPRPAAQALTRLSAEASGLAGFAAQLPPRYHDDAGDSDGGGECEGARDDG